MPHDGRGPDEEGACPRSTRLDGGELEFEGHHEFELRGRVAADRPRIIPRTLTIPSWLPRMRSDRTVGFGCVARPLAWLEAMAEPSRGTGKPFSAVTRGGTPCATDAQPAGVLR